MKIVLFCEQKYAINILQPLEVEANKEGEHSVIWYVQPKNIPDFPLKDEEMDKQHTGNLRFLPGCPIRSLQHCSLLLAGSENTNLSRLRCREKGSLGNPPLF